MVLSAFRGGVLSLKVVAVVLVACTIFILSSCGGTASHNGEHSHRALNSLIISPANPVVAIGDSERFAVTGVFSDASREDVTSTVTWTTSDPGIAVVDRLGTAAAKHSGTTVIKAVSGSLSARVTLTVPPPGLISIAISPQAPSVPKGSTVQVSATGSFTDGSTKDMTGAVTWASSSPAIAGVSASGLATGVASGTSLITATSGMIRGATTLTVAQPTLISMAIAPAGVVITKGHTQQLTVSASFSDGTKQELTAAVAWTVSPANVASVSPSGLVSTLNSGKTTITAISGVITASTEITVSAAALTSLAIAPADPSLTKGGSQQLTVTGTFSDGTTQNVTSSVAWLAPAGNVVTLSNSGMVSALATGTAVVTATSGMLSASDPITVSGANLVSVAIAPANPTIAKGQTQQLTAKGTYSDGSVQDMTGTVLWSSSDASVLDLSGSGLLTGKAEGAASVVASSGPISGTDSVTVSPAIPVSIHVIPGSSSIALGTTQQLKAVILLSDGTTKSLTAKSAWSSENSKIATVSPSGLVTSRTAGTVIIDAATDSLSGSATVIVEPLKVVEYFDHADTTGADETIRMSNGGTAGDTLCAMVYVFAPDQQMTECCGCRISRNGLRTLSLKTDLNSNPLTGNTLTNGTVEIVPADAVSNSTCDPTAFTPAGAVSVWATHLDTVPPGTVVVREGHSHLAPFTNESQNSLQTQCQFINVLGSGQGTCTCGTGE